jgi:hypothetical protein
MKRPKKGKKKQKEKIETLERETDVGKMVIGNTNHVIPQLASRVCPQCVVFIESRNVHSKQTLAKLELRHV